MGFLNFGKKKTADRDPDLEDLTVEEADYLRRLFAEMWPASEGTITLHGEYAQSSSGGQFGLYNLSRAAKAEPRITYQARGAESVRWTARSDLARVGTAPRPRTVAAEPNSPPATSPSLAAPPVEPEPVSASSQTAVAGPLAPLPPERSRKRRSGWPGRRPRSRSSRSSRPWMSPIA